VLGNQTERARDGDCAMSEGVKRAVEAAALRLLQSLARIFLAAGIGVGEVANLAKVAFVRVAREQGRREGEDPNRPNISRISVLTGITRPEVAAILAAGGARPSLSERGKQRAERVLSGWWNDPDFQTSSGEPAALPLRGRKRSFATLCERYSGERSRTAPTLQELLRVGAVVKHPDGSLRAVSRTYTTVRWDPDGIESAGRQLSEHCDTLVHNLGNPSDTRVALSVFNARLNPQYAPVLMRFVEGQAGVFAEVLDNALNDPQHTVSGKTPGSKAAKLGVGVYLFFDEHAEPQERVSKVRRRRGTSRAKPRKATRS
jgi:hypothetical protein